MDKITLCQPDDWHLHLRDGSLLTAVLSFSAKQFARAIVMPNLSPPITTVAQALSYREEILTALPSGSNFRPLMTLYLTAQTPLDEIRRLSETPEVTAVKLYPAGATTNSAAGVADLEIIYPLLAAMEKYDIPLLIHGEVTGAQYDIFDREKIFIDQHLTPMIHRFPSLRIVLEHATTQEAVEFVKQASANVAATLTPQHLLYNRNALFAGGLRPHNYCLPVLKREHHRQALVAAATSGNPKFFLGTDSAPHSTTSKENSCGCAGCFSAPAALEMYAEAFARQNALDRLEGFASFFGADFYRLPRNQSKITLQRHPWQLPEHYGNEQISITPFRAGETMQWRLTD